jgi:hypothetical protein
MTDKNKTPKFRLENIAKIPESIAEIIKEIAAEMKSSKGLQPALAGINKLDYSCDPDCFKDDGPSCPSYGCGCENYCTCDHH